MPKAETVTYVPGIVKVRAIEHGDGMQREGAAVGFHVVRRRPGDVFEINDWKEFSPRWMVFVDPGTVPEGWQEKIDAREEERGERLRLQAIEDSKRPNEIQEELLRRTVEQTVSTLSAAQALGGKMPAHEFDFSKGKRKEAHA